MFASNRRECRSTPQTQTPASKRGPRQMTATSAVADVFMGQYAAAFGASAERAEGTVAKAEALLEDLRGGAPKTGNDRKSKLAPLTTASFLSALRDAVQADILALNIDYFALHIRCVDLLRDIYVRLGADFVKYLGPGYIEKESELPFLVGYIFRIADRSGRAAEELRLVGRDDIVKSAILLKAGEVVSEVVAKEGSKELDRVKKVCRGFEWLE